MKSFKNENTGGGSEARQGERGNLLILSGLPFKQKLLVIKLTQIWDGACRFFTADDFYAFCGRGWRAHLMLHQRLAWRYSVTVFIKLPAVFNNTKVLDRLNHMMRLRRWCWWYVGLFEVLRWVNEIILWSTVTIQVIEDVQVMVLVNNFWRILTEHLSWQLTKETLKFKLFFHSCNLQFFSFSFQLSIINDVSRYFYKHIWSTSACHFKILSRSLFPIKINRKSISSHSSKSETNSLKR